MADETNSGVTRTELARLLDVAVTTVDAWVRRGCPREKQGRSFAFDLAAVSRWIRERDKPKGNLDLGQERARLARVQRRRLLMEVRRLRGELLPVEEVRRAISDLVLSVRSRLLSLPGKLAPTVAGKTPAAAQVILREGVHEALAELSRYDPGDGGQTGGSEVRTAAKPDRKRVGRPRKKAQQRKQRRAGAVADKPRAVPAGRDGRSPRSRGGRAGRHVGRAGRQE